MVPSIPAALSTIPSYTATKTINGARPAGTNPFAPVADPAAPSAASTASATNIANIQDQILADLKVQIGRGPREIKQRIAHKSPPSKGPSALGGQRSGGNGDTNGASASAGRTSKQSSASHSSRSSGNNNKSSGKSSSSTRDRDRGSSRTGSDYKASGSSSSSSSRRTNSDDRKKQRTSSTSSSTSPNKKSPKRSNGADEPPPPARRGKSASHSPSKQAAPAADKSAAKGSLADKYRSYLERNRDQSGSPTAAADEDQSPAPSAANMHSETSKETHQPHIVIIRNARGSAALLLRRRLRCGDTVPRTTTSASSSLAPSTSTASSTIGCGRSDSNDNDGVADNVRIVRDHRWLMMWTNCCLFVRRHLLPFVVDDSEDKVLFNFVVPRFLVGSAGSSDTIAVSPAPRVLCTSCRFCGVFPESFRVQCVGPGISVVRASWVSPATDTAHGE